MKTARATTEALRSDFRFPEILENFDSLKTSAEAAGVKFDATDVFTDKKTETACMKFHNAVVTNLDSRFSDEVSILCEVIESLFSSINGYFAEYFCFSGKFYHFRNGHLNSLPN